MSKIQRDLLHRLMNGNKNQQESEEEREEIELSLGLSLNGRFGLDPTKLLMRSSSIPDFVAKDNNNDDSAFGLPMACANLIRTCSLPTETEDDWRKRKELQTLRRMEAKRKRSEKQRNFKIARQRSRVFSGDILAEDDNKRQEPLFSWVNGAGPPTAIVQRTCALEAAASQGSSPPSGSPGISEFDTQLSQGLNKCCEAVSPSSIHSVPKSGQKLPPHPEAATAEKTGQFVGVAMENEPNKKPNGEKGVREVLRNVLEDMPCVSTKGDGPNGKRIEGFLYRYRRGEEVRIVCVCHGSFLSPAEFVKHAGGGDVAHPLKHIVVNPSPLL